MSADRLPEVHQAMEEEARQRLARLIPREDQERLDIEIAIRTGPAADELVRYTMEHDISLAIVGSGRDSATGGDAVRALLDRGRCAVLVLR